MQERHLNNESKINEIKISLAKIEALLNIFVAKKQKELE